MKTLILQTVLFIFLLACNTIGTNSEKNNELETDSPSATIVEKHGKLSVKNGALVNEKNEKIQLKGVSFGWHNWWSRFYNSSVVSHLVKEWECDVVRAAIGVDPDRGYINDPEFAMDCLTQVVDGAIENGIYVIIDWHSHTIRESEAIDFFQQMAAKYKDYPNVIYEIFNEPERDPWDDVKSYSEKVIKAIREIDKSNIILVGSPHWDQDVHIVADDPIVGYDNLMYTLHFYAATHHQFLRDRGDYAISKGLPLFVSECAGMEATGDGPINHEEWGKWVDWMSKNNISWIAWSIADKNETCSMLLPTASSDGNWRDNDLKEWGKIVKLEVKGNDE